MFYAQSTGAVTSGRERERGREREKDRQTDRQTESDYVDDDEYVVVCSRLAERSIFMYKSF